MNIKRLLTIVLLFAGVSAFAQQGGITGKVVSRETRLPIQHAKVTVQSDATPVTVTTSEDGKFIIENMKSGAYTLLVEAVEFMPSNVNIKVENSIKDINVVTLSPIVISTMDLDDGSFTEFDNESANDAQSMPVVLSASKDVFDNISSYKFSQVRFRPRGYETTMSDVYLNGIYFNDAISGYTPWSLWGGLNEATRNQESTSGSAVSDFGVGGINGSTNINARASQMRSGFRASVVNASAQYRFRVMATYASGENDKGWSYALSASTRQGGNDWVKGVYYNTFSYFGSIEKKINDNHRISLTAFGAPTIRGAQMATTQEVYDLVGNNFYNPNWGYQNGEERNARVRNNHEPVVMANYFYNKNKTSISAGMSYRFGKTGYSALDWYDAPDPRPDYYRNLPSYFTGASGNPLKEGYVREGWLTDDNVRQLNWDKMYHVNGQSEFTKPGSSDIYLRSKYVIEDRHIDQKDYNANVKLTTLFNDNSKFIAGVDLRVNNADFYKKIKDLMGGEYWLDIDQFAERDGRTGEAIQNDLANPNKLVKEGEVYGYNYKSHLRSGKLWAQYQYTKRAIEAYVGLEGGYTTFWREGIYQKGLFPNNSKGDSEKQNFLTYTAKAGATYKFSGNSRVYANVAYLERAPYFQEAYISPRTRNSVTPGLTTEKVMSVDINYALRTKYFQMRLTGYHAQIKDQTKLMSYFADFIDTNSDVSRSGFVNFCMEGIDQSHTGMELGIQIPIVGGLSASSAISYGLFKYTSNPYMTITQDNSETVLRENERVYWKDFKVSSTPQTAINFGLNYRSDSYWFIGIDANYFDAMYIDMNPVKRADYIHAGLSYEDSQSVAKQEKYPSAFILNANIGKSWYVMKNYQIGFSLEAKNILNTLNIKTGGYEQMRVKKATDGTPTPFDSKYFYLYGANYYLNIYFRF